VGETKYLMALKNLCDAGVGVAQRGSGVRRVLLHGRRPAQQALGGRRCVRRAWRARAALRVRATTEAAIR
jgi:hypothetical protein